MTFGNWRGFDAPGDLSAAERLNFIKVADVVRAGDAWKATLKAKDWTNLTERGNDFKDFIAEQTTSVTKLLVSLGLA